MSEILTPPGHLRNRIRSLDGRHAWRYTYFALPFADEKNRGENHENRSDRPALDLSDQSWVTKLRDHGQEAVPHRPIPVSIPLPVRDWPKPINRMRRWLLTYRTLPVGRRGGDELSSRRLTRNLLKYGAAAGVKHSSHCRSSEPTGCPNAGTSAPIIAQEKLIKKLNYPLFDRAGDTVFRIPEAACRHFF
jgi:hypothetical protein